MRVVERKGDRIMVEKYGRLVIDSTLAMITIRLLVTAYRLVRRHG